MVRTPVIHDTIRPTRTRGSSPPRQIERAGLRNHQRIIQATHTATENRGSRADTIFPGASSTSEWLPGSATTTTTPARNWAPWSAHQMNNPSRSAMVVRLPLGLPVVRSLAIHQIAVVRDGTARMVRHDRAGRYRGAARGGGAENDVAVHPNRQALRVRCPRVAHLFSSGLCGAVVESNRYRCAQFPPRDDIRFRGTGRWKSRRYGAPPSDAAARRGPSRRCSRRRDVQEGTEHSALVFEFVENRRVGCGWSRVSGDLGRRVGRACTRPTDP